IRDDSLDFDKTRHRTTCMNVNKFRSLTSLHLYRISAASIYHCVRAAKSYQKSPVSSAISSTRHTLPVAAQGCVWAWKIALLLFPCLNGRTGLCGEGAGERLSTWEDSGKTLKI